MKFKGKVLIIDDEETVRFGISAYLEDSGYQTYEATTGLEGIAKFNQYLPDVTLVDLRMPGMYGLEVLSAINAKDESAAVIVVSGAGQLEDAIQALKRGAFDYVLKPLYDMGILENAIVRAIHRKQVNIETHNNNKQVALLNQQLQHDLDSINDDNKLIRKLQNQQNKSSPLTKNNITIQQLNYPSIYISGLQSDYFCIDDDNLVFYLCNVEDKGASSTYLSASIKNWVGHYLKCSNVSNFQPKILLTELNEYLLNNKINKRTSMFFGMVNTQNDMLSYCCIGQQPTGFLVTSDGCLRLENQDNYLGQHENQHFKQHKISLTGNCHLVLTSKGIYEILNGQDNAEKDTLYQQNICDHVTEIDDLASSFKLPELQQVPEDIYMLHLTKT